MTSRPVLRAVAALAGPVALTIAGATHPAHLTAESAQWWHDLHVVMLPLFPLLGLSVWALVHRVRGGLDGWLAIAARVLAFVYAMFYTGLDVLAGIGAGALTVHRGMGGEIGSANSVMFFEGNVLADVGTWSLLVAFALVGLIHLRRVGWRSLVGTAVLLAASVSFMTSHVFWPRGVLTMAAFGVGVALLLVAERWTSHAAGEHDSRGAVAPSDRSV
ncbi:hypothetical protein GCM10009846_02010 [Agrococcus versicolor]|uniref:DUF4386 family protein n=1 Tax=Agrococcus versicolor TaxID=501482 RepID=A0ABN3AKG4_9MICO